MCMNADRDSPMAQLNSSASCSCTMLRFPKSATQRNMLHRGMHRAAALHCASREQPVRREAEPAKHTSLA
jgi:hypothetical protein